jgi:hypothetical protein
VIAILCLAICTGACHRYNHAKVTTSMSDAERNEILRRTFFVGMPVSKVNQEILELRLVKDRRWIDYRSLPNGERSATVPLRDRVYAIGPKGPGAGAPLTFFVDEESHLIRLTFSRETMPWSDDEGQRAHVIPLGVYEFPQEPVP